MVPALANVWAVGFFANRRKLMGIYSCAYFLIALTTTNADSQPGGLSIRVQNFLVVLPAALHAVFDRTKALGSLELVAAFDLTQVSFRVNV